jgi:hypothetical protein
MDSQYVSEPVIVILSPADVILSEAKDLGYSPGVDSAQNLSQENSSKDLGFSTRVEILRFTQNDKPRGKEAGCHFLRNHFY